MSLNRILNYVLLTWKEKIPSNPFYSSGKYNFQFLADEEPKQCVSRFWRPSTIIDRWENLQLMIFPENGYSKSYIVIVAWINESFEFNLHILIKALFINSHLPQIFVLIPYHIGNKSLFYLYFNWIQNDGRMTTSIKGW